jgi:virulence factor Mce-like protein
MKPIELAARLSRVRLLGARLLGAGTPGARMLRARIGQGVVIGACALAAGSCSVLPSSVQDAAGGSTHLTADFRNIAGMFEGNPITVLGLEVGKVDKIIPNGEYVEVHMTVNGDVKIPQNVTAALISPSIATDRHIELTPVYTGGPALANNAHLTVQQTRTPVELDTVIKTIDQFAAALKPVPGNTIGPLSGTLLYDMVNGQGEKIRDTLNALSGALRVGVDNKDAVSSIIVKLNELTTMLADNDQSVRDFSNKATQLSSLLAEQAPGLQATLDQLNDFLANTSGVLDQYQDRLAASLTGLTAVTDQLRRNAAGLTEIVDVAPLLLQNLDAAMDRQGRFMRLHALIGTSLSGEIVSLFCQRIQMRADGCRTGKVEDLGPDFGLTAALLGLTG